MEFRRKFRASHPRAALRHVPHLQAQIWGGREGRRARARFLLSALLLEWRHAAISFFFSSSACRISLATIHLPLFPCHLSVATFRLPLFTCHLVLHLACVLLRTRLTPCACVTVLLYRPTVPQNQRRYECLTQRMKAAALSGHAGAQVGCWARGRVGRWGVWAWAGRA